MLIFSKPGAATPYSVNLPELGQDYWYPRQEVREVATVATSTTAASYFRNITKYDVTSIVRSYSTIIDTVRAAVILAMRTSVQTSFYVSTGGKVYDCIVECELVPQGAVARLSITFRVQALIS